LFLKHKSFKKKTKFCARKRVRKKRQTGGGRNENFLLGKHGKGITAAGNE
jgi:hypothetical protein